MIKDVFDDEDCLRIYAEDQRWDKETLKQLKEEYNILDFSKEEVNIIKKYME